jgi:hypothetical protein
MTTAAEAHSIASVASRHPIHGITEFANAAARTGHTYTADDQWKIVLQTDTNALYWITAVAAGVATFLRVFVEGVALELGSLSDLTTLNADSTKHGFLKKTPNDAAQVLNGQNSYRVLLVNLSPGSETDTGFTYNSKTVYRQRFSGATFPTGQSADLITGLTGIYDCGGWVTDDSAFQRPFPVINGTNEASCFINGSGALRTFGGGTMDGHAYDFWVEYTK